MRASTISLAETVGRPRFWAKHGFGDRQIDPRGPSMFSEQIAIYRQSFGGRAFLPGDEVAQRAHGLGRNVFASIEPGADQRFVDLVEGGCFVYTDAAEAKKQFVCGHLSSLIEMPMRSKNACGVSPSSCQ